MRSFAPPRRAVLSLVAFVAMLAGLQLAAPERAHATTYATPTAIARVSGSVKALAITWKAVTNAPRYRVRISSSSTMSKSTYHRFSTNYAELTGLRAGRKYYMQVRVISADGTKSLTPYSKVYSTYTDSSGGDTLLAPTGLTANRLESDVLGFAWNPRNGATRYRVGWRPAGTTSWKTQIVSLNAATVTGLKARTTYDLRVRAVDTSGSAISNYSPVVTAKTTPGAGVLKVGSYNVRLATSSNNLMLNEQSWQERRGVVVSTITQQAPDVLGLQEAGQAWLKNADGTTISPSISQFEDLVARLGEPYALTNVHRNNCVKSTTPTNCTYADRGASRGTKIVYNTTTMKLLDEGSVGLTPMEGKTVSRYLAWATFEHRASGKRVFFVDTHLPNGNTDPATVANRELNAKEVVAAVKKLNSAKLPVILVGDLNSSKWSVPNNAPYDIIQAAGYRDPLGNAYRTTTTAPEAFVETRIRTNLSSYNGFSLTAPLRSTWINGTHIDYIFTSPMRVSEFEVVVNVDPTGAFVGTIPSDHNMLRATVEIG